MQQSAPKVVPLGLPPYLWRAVLQPIRQCHVRVCQVDGVVAWSRFACYAILLRKHETHDLAQFDIVQEELDVYRFGRVFGRSVRSLVVIEIVLGTELYVRVFDVDAHGPAQGNSHGAVTCEECPPDALPETFVGARKLRAFDATETTVSTQYR